MNSLNYRLYFDFPIEAVIKYKHLLKLKCENRNCFRGFKLIPNKHSTLNRTKGTSNILI